MHRPASKVVLLMLSVTGLMSGQSVVSGVVRERAGDELVPAAGISVFASQSDKGNVAMAETDHEGRYVLQGLREGRYTILVDRRVLVSRINGRRTDQVDVTCSGAGECGPVEFELVRGGAVEGYVVDVFGEPLQSVHLALRELNPDREDGVGDFVDGSGDSDDRGYFRIWRVRPGDYVLAPRPLKTNDGRSQYVVTPVPVTVRPGAEVSGLQIVMDLSQLYSVSGRVTDLPDDGRKRMVWADVVGGDFRSGHFTGSVEAGGRFHLARLPADAYSLRLGVFEGNQLSEQEDLLLGRLDVAGDMEGVVLRPLPATGVRGRLMLVGFEKEGSPPPPEHFALRLRPLDGAPSSVVIARRPEFRFERRDIPPGEYEIEQALYVPYLRMPDSSDGGRILVRIAEGRMEAVNLILSARGGEVTGRVWSRASADEDPVPASHYRVVLRGAAGGIASVMADQDGRFDFGSVAPGDYAIWGWRDVKQAEVWDPKIWEQAADAIRRITVEKEMQVEVELTVTP